MSEKGLGIGLAAAALCFLVFYPLSASGSGFAIYTQGASALGQGNAAIAHADDPTAVFFNPALINKLDGTQLELGTTLIFPSRKFKSDQTGKTFKAKKNVYYPSTLFITRRLNDRVSTGLGIFNPFGLGTEWDDGWEGRYITTRSRLQTFNINPVVSYQLTPAISFAAGLDILLLDATLEKKIKSSVLGIPGPTFDIGQRFEGDGNGLGYNLGILFALGKDISFGASYRSEIKVDIDGKSSSADAPPPISPLLNADGQTDLTLPQQAHAGICYEGFAPLAIEAGLRWEGWASFDELRIVLDNGRTSVTNRDWRDTFSLNLGARYRLNDTVSLLAGYLYGNTPIPDETFEPSIPDADTQVFSLGTDINYRRLQLALSYAYQLFEGRDKDNAVGALAGGAANGRYKSDLHMVAASLAYRF